MPDGVAVGEGFFQKPARLELGDDLLPGRFARKTYEDVRIADIAPPMLVRDRGVRRHHIDDRQIVPTAQIPIVLIVRRCHLQETRGVLRLCIDPLGLGIDRRPDDILIADNGDHTPDQRQSHEEPLQRRRSRVARIDRDGRIPEIGLRARRGDGDKGLFVLA